MDRWSNDRKTLLHMYIFCICIFKCVSIYSTYPNPSWSVGQPVSHFEISNLLLSVGSLGSPSNLLLSVVGTLGSPDGGRVGADVGAKRGCRAQSRIRVGPGKEAEGNEDFSRRILPGLHIFYAL